MVSVWFPGKEEYDKQTGELKEKLEVISKNRLVIKDLSKYNALMLSLKDRSNYTRIANDDLCEERINYLTPSYYSRREADGSFTSYRQTYNKRIHYTEAVYVNPRAALTRLLNLDDLREGKSYGIPEDYLLLEDGDFSLSNLVDVSIDELERIVVDWEDKNLDKNEIIRLLKNNFGSFGYFVTEALDCVDFETEVEYRKADFEQQDAFMKSEIEYLKNSGFRNGLNHSSLYERELTELHKSLSQYDEAKTNHKVLSLARRLHDRIK